MNNVPVPDYQYKVDELVKHYQRAANRIMRELRSADLASLSAANSRVILAHIAEILTELNEEARTWVEANIPVAAREGIARTLVSLGVVETLKEAETVVKFNKIHQEMVKAIVADTYSDLVAVTQNMDRKTKAALRKAVSEAMREQYARGINGAQTIRRETLKTLYEQLGDAVNTAIIDAAGRRWRPATYVETVTLEKMNQAYQESTVNEAVQRGALYGVISSHGAKDACRYHEGRIVKLSRDAPGDYPTIDELRATKQIFHVRCRHQVTPLRDLSRLPESVRKKAEEQDALGRKAIAAGGRNPKDVE